MKNDYKKVLSTLKKINKALDFADQIIVEIDALLLQYSKEVK